MNQSIPWILVGLAAVVFAIDLILHRRFAARVVRQARQEANHLTEEAAGEADTRRREADIEARDRLETAEREREEHGREQNQRLDDWERTLDQRERNLDRKATLLGEKHQEARTLQAGLEEERAAVTALRRDVDRGQAEQTARLERIAAMTAAEARHELMRQMEAEARHEAGQILKRITEETRERVEEDARRLLANTLPKVPVTEISDNLVCRVTIPNDEMKGRIIGREGRNIRSIEMNTGVDIIVDDTPGTIILSSFDPLRREMARIAIEKLIEDGRIHPARIEEVTAKVREEFEQRIVEEGEAAAFDLAVPNIHPKLIRLIGTLKYHGRIGQNLLSHTLEVAHLAGALAQELSLDIDLVRRAGLLHEVGQVGESIAGSPHLLASAELAARYNEPDNVVHCLRVLGGAAEPRLVEPVLLQVAETVSLNRPGAQKVGIETQVSRLRRLEEIARSFHGVRTAYAVRAGKEVRVIVDSGTLPDSEVPWLSKSIAARISADQVCTGHVKIAVIRETRATDYAL